MFEIQELRVLVSIVDQGGFQKASKVLRISQPAVSQSLANLERKLGEQLVIRKNPITPTTVGKALLEKARLILYTEDAFARDLQRIKHGYMQKLTIAVDYLITEYFCHNLLAATFMEFPEINFTVKSLASREIIPAIQNGWYDFGFGAFQKDMRNLKAKKNFTETIYLVTGRKNPLLKLYDQDFNKFLSNNVLLTSYLDQPSSRPADKKIRNYFRDVWQIDSVNMQINLLAKGIGISYLPATVLDTHPKARRFFRLEKASFFAVSKPYGLFYRSDRRLSQVAETFLKKAENELTNRG